MGQNGPQVFIQCFKMSLYHSSVWVYFIAICDVTGQKCNHFHCINHSLFMEVGHFSPISHY